MPIPNASSAVVEDAKIREYLLNLTHPDGGSKAKWFHSLGYNLEKLSRGDVGTVVHIYKGGKGYEVEFVDGGGRTVALVTVGAEDVRPIKAGELLHTRITV